MSTRLTLIANAPTAAVRAAAFPLDEGIDAAGERDVLALAGEFPRASSSWTSPARRAVETAAALGLDAKLDPALRDLDLGRWAGLSFDAVEAAEPEAVAVWLRDPASAPHGGESVAQLFARVGHWLTARNSEGGRVAAVTHPAVIRAAIAVAIEANPLAFWRIDIAPLGLAELRSNGARWTLRTLKG